MAVFEQHEPRTALQRSYPKKGFETATFRQFGRLKYKLVNTKGKSLEEKEDIILELREMGYDRFQLTSDGLWARKSSWEH